MVMKKDMTPEQLRAKKNDDAVVYKVMIALILLCGALLGIIIAMAFPTHMFVG